MKRIRLDHRALLAALGVLVLGAAGLAYSGDRKDSRARASASCAAPAFTVHAGGASIAGLPLTYAARSCEAPVAVPAAAGGTAPPALRNDHTTFIYGDCTPDGPRRDPGGCAAPLEIQSAPTCERNYRLYRSVDGRLYPYKRLTIRGVPAASFDRGTTIEIYTGRTTISIFGNRRSMVRRAAESLYPLSKAEAPTLRSASSGYVARFARTARPARADKGPLARPASGAIGREC
jgi:hypothetical protein